jgi:hypothetical protein
MDDGQIAHILSRMEREQTKNFRTNGANSCASPKFNRDEKCAVLVSNQRTVVMPESSSWSVRQSRIHFGTEVSTRVHAGSRKAGIGK